MGGGEIKLSFGLLREMLGCRDIVSASFSDWSSFCITEEGLATAFFCLLISQRGPSDSSCTEWERHHACEFCLLDSYLWKFHEASGMWQTFVFIFLCNVSFHNFRCPKEYFKWAVGRLWTRGCWGWYYLKLEVPISLEYLWQYLMSYKNIYCWAILRYFVEI